MVAGITGRRLVSEVPAALAQILGLEANAVRVQREMGETVDLVLEAAGQTFVVECKTPANVGPIEAAARKATEYARRYKRGALPMIAVPYMGEGGKRVCEDARVAWLDLSGNARIITPRLRVIVDGRPNRFKSPGRPSSLFAPKSSRVARWLLMHTEHPFTQRELARSTNVGEGFVSRIVSGLKTDGYVIRDPNGTIRVKDPQLLLDAWRDVYHFSRHTLIKGHVTARSGDALTRRVAQVFRDQGVEHAATGLAAAWQFTRFAVFRIATFYVASHPTEAQLMQLGFREDERGANLWIAVPNDEGVFQGASMIREVSCVHPVQAYLDLQEHPERSAEAADQLKSEYLRWARHA
jgi:hypothetical protein